MTDSAAGPPGDAAGDPPAATTAREDVSTEARARTLAATLRQLGLPAVLSARDRGRDLWSRAAGVLWAAAIGLLAIAFLLRAFDVLARNPAQEGEAWTVVPDEVFVLLAVCLFFAVLAPVLWIGLALLVRHVPERVAEGLGVAGAVALVTLSPVAAGPDGPGFVDCLVVLVLILAAGYLGVGSVLAWAGRRVLWELSSLGPMVARVLPTFMLASLFFFYNAEIWQVMVALSWPRIIAVVAVMVVLTLLLVAVTTRDEVSSLLEARREDPEHEDGPDLRWDERFNVLLVPSLVTLIQTTLFATLVFGFFLMFGQLSVSDATIVQWTGRPIDASLRETYRLPFDVSLVKVAVTLAGFSALNFAASTASDSGHRQRFVSPLISEAILGLDTRDAYLAVRPRRAERRREG